ncbi:MAG: hypothetical protein Q8L39_06890 [Burkholderiales bacterium]|nr:hypothetical protein [Burkholderiales bacterium]
MDQKRLFESALTFVVAAVALSWLVYRFDTVLLERLLPIFRSELNWLMPSFRIDSLDWRIERGETVVTLSATLIEHRVIMNQAFPAGVSINVSTLAAHAWVHPGLILSLCIAWPGIAWKLKPLLILIALPLVLLAELLDIPLMLWGAMEDFLYWQVDSARIAESLGSRVQHFLDGGGRYALAIVLALLAISLFRKYLPGGPAPTQ